MKGLHNMAAPYNIAVQDNNSVRNVAGNGQRCRLELGQSRKTLVTQYTKSWTSKPLFKKTCIQLHDPAYLTKCPWLVKAGQLCGNRRRDAGGDVYLARAVSGSIEIGNGTLSLYRSGATTTYSNAITSLSGTTGTLTVDGAGSNAGTGTNSTYATGTITVDGTLTVNGRQKGPGSFPIRCLIYGTRLPSRTLQLNIFQKRVIIHDSGI